MKKELLTKIKQKAQDFVGTPLRGGAGRYYMEKKANAGIKADRKSLKDIHDSYDYPKSYPSAKQEKSVEIISERLKKRKNYY